MRSKEPHLHFATVLTSEVFLLEVFLWRWYLGINHANSGGLLGCPIWLYQVQDDSQVDLVPHHWRCRPELFGKDGQANHKKTCMDLVFGWGVCRDCQVKELYVFVRLCMHVCRCVCLPSVCRSVCKSVCMYLSLHGRPNESSRWLKASQCVDGFIGGCERIYYFPMRLSLPSDNFWQSNAALENPYFQTSNTVRDFPSIFYKLFGCRLD